MCSPCLFSCQGVVLGPTSIQLRGMTCQICIPSIRSHQYRWNNQRLVGHGDSELRDMEGKLQGRPPITYYHGLPRDFILAIASDYLRPACTKLLYCLLSILPTDTQPHGIDLYLQKTRLERGPSKTQCIHQARMLLSTVNDLHKTQKTFTHYKCAHI